MAEASCVTDRPQNQERYVNRDSTRSNGWFFSDFADAPRVSTSSTAFHLEEVGRFGSDDGEESLGDISKVAVSEDLVAISDFRNCEIVVFTRKTRKVYSRFGRCGQGPEEFQNFFGGVIAIKNRQVMAIDQGVRRVRTFDLSGRVLSSIWLDTIAVPIGSSAESMAWRGDLIFLTLHLPSHRRIEGTQVKRSEQEPIMRVLDATTGKYLTGHLVDGRHVAEESFGLARTARTCVTTSEADRAIVAWNFWSHQLVAFRPEGEVVLNANVALPEPPRYIDPKSKATMPNSLLEIACGDSLAIATWSSVPQPGEMVSSAEHLFLDLRSRSISQLSVSTAEEGLLGRLAAAHAQSFFFKHNVRFGYPLVIEYVARTAAAEPTKP